MLQRLRIQNLAIIDDLTIDFAEGFTAMTGETGAGKSIILGALNLVLGERAARTLIRAGCETCTVEAVFELSRLAPGLKELIETSGLEPCEEDHLLLKRTFSVAGANRHGIGSGQP